MPLCDPVVDERLSLRGLGFKGNVVQGTKNYFVTEAIELPKFTDAPDVSRPGGSCRIQISYAK